MRGKCWKERAEEKGEDGVCVWRESVKESLREERTGKECVCFGERV